MSEIRDNSLEPKKARTIEVLISGALASFVVVLEQTFVEKSEEKEILNAIGECTTWITAIFDACMLDNIVADAPEILWRIEEIVQTMNSAGKTEIHTSIHEVFASSETDAIEAIKQSASPTMTRKYSYRIMRDNDEQQQ